MLSSPLIFLKKQFLIKIGLTSHILRNPDSSVRDPDENFEFNIKEFWKVMFDDLEIVIPAYTIKF